MIFIFHIRPFWARWSPLYVRISIFWVNPENLECACIYIFVSTCVFYSYPWDAQDSRGISVTRAREIVRSYVATSGTRACAWGHISHARTCHGVCTQLVFIFFSREFWFMDIGPWNQISWDQNPHGLAGARTTLEWVCDFSSKNRQHACFAFSNFFTKAC